MGVAVLNPKDCLQNPLSSRQDLIYPAHRVRASRNPNPHRPNNKAQSNRRKRSPNASPPNRATVPVSVPQQVASKNLVMGQVKILKRGEQIATTKPKNDDLDLGSTHRLGPDPELVPTQIRLADAKPNGFYAGSAFVTSPPPSSLPLPAFFTKKSVGVDDATSDLRRILGLSL